MNRRPMPWISIAAALALTAGTVAACGDREAESETPVAEAEVKTDLPEAAVSDAQLQATADQAAAAASTTSPVTQGAAAGAGATGTTAATTTTTTAPTEAAPAH